MKNPSWALKIMRLSYGLYIAIAVLLFLTGCGSINNGGAEQAILTNDGFHNKYTATFQPSTPSSTTATFPNKTINEAKSKVLLASLNGLQVTINTTVDTSGVAVWECSITGTVHNNGYRNTPYLATNGLQFQISFLNAAGAGVGPYWVTQVPIIQECGKDDQTINETKRFDIDITQGVYAASVEVTECAWVKCE